MKSYYVYILTNINHTALYTGVTDNLERRIIQHKRGEYDGFTKRYNINRLIYYEETGDITAAIEREKQIKKWNRAWKEELISKRNPYWKDLSEEWFE